MKTSNKLLLAGFLAVVLLITAIHISLYAKYKNGDYTVYHPEDYLPAQDMQPFPNILFVSILNLHGATVKFSDVAAVEKADADDIKYVQKGDTLLISGRHGEGHGGLGYPVEFHVPSNVTLSVVNSSLFFVTGKKNAEYNPVIYLKKSSAIFSGVQSPLELGHVKVVASDSSAALFQGNTQLTHLEVQLSNSAIEYGEGNFGRLSIVTDSLSRISLQSKHLLKANIKTTGSQ